MEEEFFSSPASPWDSIRIGCAHAPPAGGRRLGQGQREEVHQTERRVGWGSWMRKVMPNAEFSVSVVPESQRHHETFPSLVLWVRCKELTKARWCRVVVWCAQLPLPLSSCPLLLCTEAEPRAWTFPTSLSSVPYQSPEKGKVLGVIVKRGGNTMLVCVGNCQRE